MKNTLSPIETSHRSTFDDLLAQKPGTETLLLTEKDSKLECLAYLIPPKLKPNCLLLRHPLALFLPTRSWKMSLLIGELSARWLAWQLKRHGYKVSLTYVTCTSIDSQRSQIHALVLGTLELPRGLDILSVTRLHNSYFDFRPARPLTTLSSLLVRVNSLAEQDHQ